MCAWRPFGPPPPPPLPPLLAPDIVAQGSEKAYLAKILAESRSVLDADLAEFERLGGRPDALVYRKPVSNAKGLTLARLEAEVAMDADQLFRLMTTQEGKCIIYPFPREHHSELVQRLRMPGAGEAAVVYSEAPRFLGFLLRPREYVTCDAAAPGERLFVCKSCEVAQGPLAAPRKGKLRANLLFALRTQPIAGQPGRCRMQMVNWLDLGRDTVPTWLANTVTERWFFPALMRRLRRRLAKEAG